MSTITQKRLKELFRYSPETGDFTRLISICRLAKAGRVAGTKTKRGYIRINVDGVLYYSHRLVFLYVYGYLPENDVDHINRNKSDNRIENLREVSRQCNSINANISKSNTSGITGVYLNKKKKNWCAQICINRKVINLGCFNKKHNAALARWEAEKKYNFPNCNTTSTAYLYLKESRQ